jgi:hypothetical protein
VSKVRLKGRSGAFVPPLTSAPPRAAQQAAAPQRRNEDLVCVPKRTFDELTRSAQRAAKDAPPADASTCACESLAVEAKHGE